MCLDHLGSAVMELVAIDLILWLGFGLLIWVLKDGLQNIDNDLRNYRMHRTGQHGIQRAGTATPQRLMEPIGHYLDQLIYGYAIIDGRHYRFDHVCPKELATRLPDTQRWIAPGLVYVEAPLPAV